MLRKILLASAAAAAGYVLGTRAGFGAAVRDYIENDGEMLERVAIQSDKYNYPVTVDEEELADTLNEAQESHQRTYQ